MKRITYLPVKYNNLSKKDRIKQINNLKNKEWKKQVDEKYLVKYYINKNIISGVCFSYLFNYGDIPKGCTIKINLFFLDRCRTNYSNILKYLKILNKLYTGVSIKIEKFNNNLWVVVKFNKCYPNVVARDITTRIRFLFESPYNKIIDDLLSKENFCLSDIEKYISAGHTYINTGHYLFDNRSKILKYNEDYEKRFLSAHEINNLHKTFNKF